jgi:uncharacterized protein YkwD
MGRALLAALILAFAGMASAPTGGEAAATVTALKVDAAAAARIISDYRAKKGLPPVKVEARLVKMATVHAEKMATTDRLDHVLPGEGSFGQRINAANYEAAFAAENIGAGYDTLAEAMAGWETSPAHNANLLQPNVTEIGIALYSTSVGQYHTYWALVLARPAARPPAGTSAAPSVTIGPLGIFSQ